MQVTLYFFESKDVTLGDCFGLGLPKWYDETTGSWDDGRRYELPDGYRVGENVYGESMIFDPRNRGCDIVIHTSRRPQLISELTSMPVLKESV